MEKNAQIGQIDARLVQAARLVPQQVGQVKLSKTQLRVLQAMRKGEQVTPSQIADRCDLSNSWASTLLRRLSEKAYVTRQAFACPAGGVEYVYVIA
ncbi:MarR family transcriptional regulator [Photobacterium sp. SP02]|uniref:MarR family transcriptional regulator n=1 Tax=Photobacterium sp. SP02 TaxID=3032280 RepID=UPI003145264A